MNPKPNNCKAVFFCIDTKKCVHYKKPKLKNPCKTCKGKTNNTCNEEIEAACFARDEYHEQKQLCHHSKGLLGRCFNLIAQVQEITAYLKSIGIEPEYHGGLRCSAECSLVHPFDCAEDCELRMTEE
jgi:hypothetical protein